MTNFRDADTRRGKLRSRGHLIGDFLASDAPPSAWLADVDGEQYAGFNLVVFAGGELGYLSNRGGGLRRLEPGVYGVANATLDTPWVKVERSKAALLDLISSERVNETSLLHLLGDRKKARVGEVDASAVSFAEAHTRSAPFIVHPDFGTRCSTVILRDDQGRVRFTEARFRPDGSADGRSAFSFSVAS